MESTVNIKLMYVHCRPNGYNLNHKETTYRSGITLRRNGGSVRTSQEIRRENLRYLIQIKYGGVTNRMATETGIQQMQLARVFLKTHNRRDVGTKLARRIEEAAGLDEGWLDQDHARSDDISTRMDLLDLSSRKAIESVIDAMLQQQAQEAESK